MKVHVPGHKVTFRSKDGLQLAGEFCGDPQHPPVILLHGGGQTRHAWRRTQIALAQAGYYSLAMDLRGHGESDWSEAGSYAAEYFVDDLKTVIASLSARPVVVGASLGGIVTLVAQGESEELLTRAVVLVDITPRVEGKGVERIVAFMRSNHDGFASLEEASRAVGEYLSHRSSNKREPSDIVGLKKNLRRREDGRYYWHWDPLLVSDEFLAQVNCEERLLAAAKNIRVPLLLVRGMLSDMVTTSIVEEFLEHVPGAQFVDVPAAGHMVAGDSNDVFTEALIGFLRNSHLE
ncbi:MAG: alpha/beta hydrolase [Cyanobacteria bacterium SZAS LIN-2]|nr:alpha/beta hydrolase [Cyanobacteria bacterium SZAS LIN-3]MBS1999044.1 alpha/beta hydrolase [Cyanobacteria bacterium SZAS LIN-2]